MRRLGHRIVDDMLDLHRRHADEPVWRPVPPDVHSALTVSVPMCARDPQDVYEDFARLVLPYRVGNVHPRFWGRVMGTGTVGGMFAGLLGAAMNSNASGIASSTPLVEAQVIRWCQQLLGWDKSGLEANDGEPGGILLSGCSTANLVCLGVMRDAMAQRLCGRTTRVAGIRAFSIPPVIYASSEVHVSIDRAVALLGFGLDSIRRIGCDADGAMLIDDLRAAIEADEAAGRLPIAIVGTAGTVNTGAIDDLAAIADLAQAHELWFHVDGAFGAWARLGQAISSSCRARLDALHWADSLAVDLHKWMYVEYGIACALVRDAKAHRAAFAHQAAYLGAAARGAESDTNRFNELGPELSREFRGLRAWWSLQQHGVARYAAAIDRNIAQARYLAERVVRHPRLELLAPSGPDAVLNVVVFRYAAPMGAAAVDRVNAELLMRLHERGIAVPTTGMARGVRGLRVAITNHRSRQSDFDVLVDAVVQLGDEIIAGT